MKPRGSRPRRPPRRAILIVCEGAETEPCYFKALEALRLKKQRASEARKSNVVAAFEEVWVVFDIEHPGNGRQRAIAPAVQSALASACKPVLSRPSFEVWYLLHDRPTPPGVASSEECKPHLRKLIGAYGKDGATALKAAEWALPNTRTALTHGHRQDVFSLPDSAPAFHIPSAVGTAVHRLVQALVDMSSDEAGKRTLGIIAASS